MASFGRTARRPNWLRLGNSLLARSIDTFRNSTHHNGSMGSFGETVSWEIAPDCSTHPPEIAVGFVWENGPPTELASFGECPAGPNWLRLGKRPADRIGFVWGTASRPGASTLFGTPRIITGQWVRLGKPFRGRSRPFVRPILPRSPLASFGRTARRPNWLRLGERRADRIGFVWENGPPTELASFGERSPSGSAEGDLSGTNCQRTVETKLHLHHRRMGGMMFGMRRDSDNGATSPGRSWSWAVGCRGRRCPYRWHASSIQEPLHAMVLQPLSKIVESQFKILAGLSHFIDRDNGKHQPCRSK